jgi:hypothetical protein
MSSYAAIVQPYVGDRYALPTAELQFPSELYLFYPQPAPYYCNISTQPDTFSLVSLGLPSITTDENLGTVAYGDPFPSTWPRFFQYCQISALNIPRPNSSAVDTFLATIRQTTTLPSGPVTPILTPVQNPMMNGSSLFESSNLSSTVVNITWSTPSSGTPFGYYVSVFQLTNLPSGTGYLLAGRYGTSQTSVSIPFLAAGNTYVFTITANVDGGSVIDKSPLRSKIPIAEAGVVSAPFVTLPANGSAGALNLH